jgi:hypothetical protein
MCDGDDQAKGEPGVDPQTPCADWQLRRAKVKRPLGELMADSGAERVEDASRRSRQYRPRNKQHDPDNSQKRDERRDPDDHAAHCRSFRLKPEATLTPSG